jgi:cyclopropane fatty-acyl-phospholipid synthase-like methyltransferase
VIEQGLLQPARALELGCGTGVNACYLAEQGFSITAVDLSPTAIERARKRAAKQGVQVDFVCADLADLPTYDDPFGFVFDRGCYHAVRRSNLAGYQDALSRATAAGTRMLLLAGNADEQASPGPPRVTEQEIRDELGTLFDIQRLRAFQLLGADKQPLHLFWSCWMVRR